MDKEKELLLKGIHLGIFLAFADAEAESKVILGYMKSRLSTAEQNKADEKSRDSLRAQVELYKEVLDDFSDRKCNSITKYFSKLTIDECNFVFAKIKELCLGSAQDVCDEFNHVITEVLLRR